MAKITEDFNWINTKDELPKRHELVMCCDSKGEVWKGMLMSGLVWNRLDSDSIRSLYEIEKWSVLPNPHRMGETENSMTDNFWMKHGFHKYNKTQFQSDGVMYNFQKCYKDEIGKKYFLSVAKYDWRQYKRLDTPDFTYSMSTQLYQKGTHKAINIEFFDQTLEEAEDFIESLFKENKLDYYEEWE